MKIDLYARKIGQPGAVFLETINVPDSTGLEYRVPVRQPFQMIADVAKALHEDVTLTIAHRTFRYMHNPMQSFLGQNRAYVEI